MRARQLLGAAAALAAAAVWIGPATAEVAQKDGVRVSVTGTISPTKLPRTGTAPVAASLGGRIATANPSRFPKLTEIAIAINAHGQLNMKGIPVCRLGHISPSTTAEALIACGSSQIGEGRFSADVRIPDQSPFPSEGKVLAFNGKLNGRRAIFAHIYGTRPVPTSYVLVFEISETKGTFGTTLKASLPRVTGEWGYVTGLDLKLERSVLAAGCPAPKGFTSVVFPLFRTTFAFKGGPNLTSTLTRSCKVR